MPSVGFPLLTIIVFVPLGGALLAALVPGERLGRGVALLAALAEAGLVAHLLVEFQQGRAGFQFVSRHPWISSFGIEWRVGVDGISLFLVAMAALLFPVAMVGSSLRDGSRSFMAWMLVLEAACIAAFLSMDLFLFFVCYEVTLVPAYFAVLGPGGGPRRSSAAIKLFLYTFAGSAFMFVGILSLSLLTASSNGGHSTFDLITLTRLAGGLPHADQVLIFSAIAVGFAVKTPLVPFHTWLPDAYSEAPTPASMVIGGVMFALGGYGLLRLGVYLLPRAATDMAPVLLTLAAVGVVYGAVAAIMQRDLKRVVSYSAVVSVALVVLGEYAFSSQGVSGGVLQMVNESLTLGALFFVVGMVGERRGTLRFGELGGLQKTMPIVAAVSLAVFMSAIGLPGLNSFVSEFLVLAGTFATHRWWAVVATSVVVTSVIYFLWAYQRTFHGPLGSTGALSAGTDALRDISWREAIAIAPLLAGIVFVGLYPKPLLDRVTPSVNYLLEHVQAVDPAAHVLPQGSRAVLYTVPADQDVDAHLVAGAP
jgi:NADH-quinone oxidoreductase subunit M